MEIKEIQDLIKFVAKSGVSEVSIEQENFKITIKTGKEQTVVNATLPVAQALPQAAPAQPAPQAPPPASETPPPASPAKGGGDAGNQLTITSPMIGTFYRSSSPDSPALVEVGDEIRQGQVVCIIEAMKLFNEIESEVSGRVVKILVENASPVEYDQPLFLVEPL